MRSRSVFLAFALSTACAGPSDEHLPPPLSSGSVALDEQSRQSLEIVVRASWGAGTGQLGRTEPSEASPECPHSLAVDSAGGVHVLDQVNQALHGTG